MATCCTHVVNHVYFAGFSTIVLRNIPKKLFHRNFSRRVKGKRQEIIKQKDSVDIEGILKSSRAAPMGKPVVETAASINETPKDIEIKKWQVSEERTNLLKKGERRVAIIAVVTMLIGYGVIKLMFYGAEKRKPSEAAEQVV